MGRHREFDTEEALDAAVAVFWRKGYEGTSFEDLTRATGVARPGLYAAFGNKESLFLKVLDRYESKYMTFMIDALGEPTSRRVVGRILAESLAVQTLDRDTLGCLGTNGALACSEDAEPIRQELVRRRRSTEAALKRRLERARDEGDLPGSSDCAVLASYVMTINQGLAVQAKAGASVPVLRGVVEHVLSTWPAPPTRKR